MSEPTDIELQAYVDDQLDPGQRFAIEMHLADHPTQAAQVMHDLGTRTGLRLLGGDDRPVPPAMAAQAAALARPQGRWRRLTIGVGAIGGGALAATILGGLLLFGRPPAYVDMAVESHRVAMMRAHMVSQIEAPAFDAGEIEARTRIELPGLPANWHITDAQIFPTEQGPALLVAVRTGDRQSLSLFALRQKSGAPERPDAVREGAESVAYWRRGDMSYALTGEGEPKAIDEIAERLVRSWL